MAFAAAVLMPVAPLEAAPAGAALAMACSGCHGPQGESAETADTRTIPSLAGMAPAKFKRHMADFRGGDGTIMNRIAPAYDAEQVAALADYFAHQPKVAPHEPDDASP